MKTARQLKRIRESYQKRERQQGVDLVVDQIVGCKDPERLREIIHAWLSGVNQAEKDSENIFQNY
jgi:hypothetical protein